MRRGLRRNKVAAGRGNLYPCTFVMSGVRPGKQEQNQQLLLRRSCRQERKVEFGMEDALARVATGTRVKQRAVIESRRTQRGAGNARACPGTWLGGAPRTLRSTHPLPQGHPYSPVGHRIFLGASGALSAVPLCNIHSCCCLVSFLLPFFLHVPISFYKNASCTPFESDNNPLRCCFADTSIILCFKTQFKLFNPAHHHRHVRKQQGTSK